MDMKFVGDVIDHLNAEFGDFIPVEGGMRDRAIKRLLSKRCSDDELREAARWLSQHWEQKKSPQLHDLLAIIDRTMNGKHGREKILDASGRASELKMRYTDTYLAMNARRGDARCEICAADFVGRGVDEDDPLLWHTHFHLADICADAALEIAIANAVRLVGHSLEKKCRPMNQEELDSRFGRFMALRKAMCPQFESAVRK